MKVREIKDPEIRVVKVRSIFAPKPWRHPIQAWRMRRLSRRIQANQAAINSLITPEMAAEFARREEDAFIRGIAIRGCTVDGCSNPAPGYDVFCDEHSPPDWRCECGDLNRAHEAFCYRCGAGSPEDA